MDRGLFLMDLINRDWMTQNSLNRYWRHPSGEYVLSYKIETKDGISCMKRTLINQTTGAKIEHEFGLRSYSLAEIETIMKHNGLIIRDLFGGFDGRRYGTNTPRMIVLSQKV